MLGTEELSWAFAFLGWEDALRARVCRRWKEAAAAALSSGGDEAIRVQLAGDDQFRALDMLGRSFPGIVHLQIRLGRGGPGGRSSIRFQDGDDPVRGDEDDSDSDDSAAGSVRHRLSIISNFRNLRHLSIVFFGATLNGRYPCLVDFPFLRHLELSVGGHVKLDLSELSGCPLLETLSLCLSGQQLTGNLNSLCRLIKLKELSLYEECPIKGRFMDLSKLPYLEKLHLPDIHVEGDLSDIGENDFPMLKEFRPPNFKVRHISEADTMAKELYKLKKKRSELNIYCALSKESPEMYYGVCPVDSPLSFKLVEAGNRLGWRWFGHSFGRQPEGFACCEINWIDPEPVGGSEDFLEYEKQLATLPGSVVFKGLHEPPTPEIEFRRVVARYQHGKRKRTS